MPLFRNFWKKRDAEEDDSSGDECVDPDADSLSYVGTAAYDVLRKKHNHHHMELWNVTTGSVVGDVHQTPIGTWERTDRQDPEEGHDDWFPEKLGEIISRTESWCDIMSLAPPDGLFLEHFRNALIKIVRRRQELEEETGGLGDREIVIRMMFGNIVGMPTNCNMVIEALTKDLPDFASDHIQLWVGSWRKGVSWNHAKIIAVDGKYLWTGGHNFWDAHYLREDPVCDLSIELAGSVTDDAHRFANAQWGYIIKKQSTNWGQFVNKWVPDALDVPRTARVTISEFPTPDESVDDVAAEFPPYYKTKKSFNRRGPGREEVPEVPIITMGRYGRLIKKARPADDAIVAMIKSASKIVRFALQDIGPVTIPGTKQALPGCCWPEEYLNAMAYALWSKEVDIEIVLSNPGSIPGNLSPTEANYGNGWDCVDVAAEIIKSIQAQYPEAQDDELRRKVQDNLRVCFLRCPKGGNHYYDGQSLGLHSKHFIVDDRCCYIGSQNLYICDLAEWGVVIDHEESVLKIKADFWDKMWEVSYLPDDCDVDKVMDGLEIDRGTPDTYHLTKLQIQQAMEKSSLYPSPSTSIFNAKTELKIDEDDDDDDLSSGAE